MSYTDVANRIAKDLLATEVHSLMTGSQVMKIFMSKKIMDYERNSSVEAESILLDYAQNTNAKIMGDFIERYIDLDEAVVDDRYQLMADSDMIAKINKAEKQRLSHYKRVYAKYKDPKIVYNHSIGRVVMLDHGYNVGGIRYRIHNASYSTKLVGESGCSEDFKAMFEKHGEAKVYEIILSGIRNRFKRKGYGKKLYEEVADKIRDGYFIPDVCGESGSTSQEAQNVWRSLARKHSSSGMVLYIK